MTQIAAWEEHGTRYLMGDVLVTRMGLFNFEGDHVPIPTAEDASAALPKKYGIQITDLSQKIYIISDNVAVGWAISRAIAAEVISDLFNAFEGKAPSVAEVKAFLCGREKTEEDTCLLIGWIVENSNASCFRWISQSPDEFTTGDQFVEGFGKDFFNEIVKPTGESGGDPLINSALGKLANLLSYEMLEGKNLQWQFGGAYQLIYYADGGFRHLTSATFVTFTATEQENGEVQFGFVSRILKFQFEDGILKMMAVSKSANGNVSSRMYYAYAIHTGKPQPPPAPDGLSLISDYHAILVDIRFRDGVRGELATTYARDIPNPPLQITRTPEALETVDISNRFLARVIKLIKDRNPDKSAFPTRDWLTKQ
ncbi:MAG TPA: hypothetical protein VN937_17815 [Blastocatellia bacterium]|nr:hypothetical protein [Blastocatellia bacterium]